MKNRLFTIVLILFAAVKILHSQDYELSEQSWFGFRAGLSHMQVRDNSVNGLVHTGPGLNASLLYTSRCCNFLQEMELGVGMNFLQSKFETDMETYFIQGFLQYNLKRAVTRLNGRGELFLGGQAKIDASQGIYSNWDENHFYWLTSYSVGFSGNVNYRVSSKSSVSVGIGLPLISLVSRPPERQLFHEANPELGYVLNSIHTDPALLFATGHFNPEVKLSIHSHIGERSSGSIFWKFSYTHTNMEGSNELNILNHAVGIGLLF